MQHNGQPAVDLVPLGDRMRMISLFRVCAVAIILVAWVTVPASRGASLEATAAVALGYLAATLLIEYAWRRSGRRASWIFPTVAMADSVFLAYASYGVAGLDSPLLHVILVQLVTVSLLASFRTGLKLALFNSWLLFGAVYLQEGGVLDTLGGEAIAFGDATYRALAVEVALFFAVTIATTAFAATNERELRRRRYDLEELARFALRLEAEEHPERVAACLLDGVSEIYGCEPSCVVRRDSAGALEVLADRAGAEPATAHGTPERLAVGRAPIIHQALTADATRLVGWRGDAGDDAVLGRFARGANVAIIPLRGSHGEVVGALVTEHPARRGSRIERRALEMMERFASHASLALQNAYLLTEVRALALTDPLTGLANRRQLDQTLDRGCAQVARGHGTLALMMVDIDHFKRLNDTHGHQAGDEVLAEVARALDRDLRAGDLAARYGGEEFSIVMPAAAGADVLAAGERLRRRIAAMPGEISVTVSVGVAWAPEHGTNRAELIQAADAALYRAKQAGRNRVEAAPRRELHAPAA